MSCINRITDGITKDCSAINAAIGVDKDLYLINYEDIDVSATKDDANREIDNTNGNEGGLKQLISTDGADLVPIIFEGTDYSVQPSVTAEVRDNGDTWYIHTIVFTAYNKTAKARKVIEAIGTSKVVAVAKDRSTGLYEVFGLEIGLKCTAVERPYTGAQNSNFYTVTIATPDLAVIRESTLGELVTSINATV